MAKDSKHPEEKPAQTPKSKHAVKRAKDTEFADELTKSDIQSAFKNPVTGEERLY
ncbi:hypothetical protein [Paenibacillus macerans]|uniref:hypothetical protein n=1 Tax=Paenibacillus macerans TaxID=44252 RepID=UPI003D31FAD7